METIIIWKLEKKSTRLVLKATWDPEAFWLELYRKNKLAERSEEIYDWDDELIGLMEKYNWKAYETEYVHPLFATLIGNFRKLYGHYQKPNSRERILELYDRFLSNEEIILKRTANEFSVGTEEIKRDIKIIRDFLKIKEKEIKYIKTDKVYKIS